MSTGIQTPQSIVSTFTPFGPPILSAHGFPKRVLLASTQPFAQEFIDATPYSESAAQWLISLLDLLAGIVNRNEDLSHVAITETEYQQFSTILDDLVYGVGEDENHPLSAAMALVGVLIKTYEDKTYEDQHFPKLMDLYPELAEETAVATVSESKNGTAPISGQIETDFVIVAFSIGCLLWKSGKAEKAISAYDLAIRINPDYASIYAGRGEAKSDLNDFMGAKRDLQKALELAEKQKEDGFSTAIEERLQALDVVEAVIGYFSEPRFAKFSMLRACGIQMGKIHIRADIVLRDEGGNFIAIAECKLSGRTHYTEPLKSYLCATDTPFGIFASSTNRDSWIFYENLRHNRFRQIERSDFEQKVLEFHKKGNLYETRR